MRSGLQELLFEEGSYLLQARYKDYIAFGFDLSLLRRASLASTATIATVYSSCCLPAGVACSCHGARGVACRCCRLPPAMTWTLWR